MVGGGSRRDEGSMVINNTNVFAALESLRKKKKSDKERSKKGSLKEHSNTEPQVFWAPAPLTVKSWADVDEDDDDDYFATTAPIQSVWRTLEQEKTEEKPTYAEQSGSEEDILDEGDDVEEEHDHEPIIHPESVVKKPAEISAPKEAERQLSKKERKKKELAELEALLADFGVSQKQNDCQDESHDAAQEKKDVQPNGDGEKDVVPAGSKSAKKKKKDKSSKEVKETQNQRNESADEAVGSTSQAEEDASTVGCQRTTKEDGIHEEKEIK